MIGMKKAAAAEYATMKAFLSFYTDRYFRLENLPPEQRPIACLEILEKMGKAMAARGLRQAINDCVEKSLLFDHKEVEKLDSELRTLGIVTLSELRRRYSKAYARIRKQGRVKNDTEYYLIRNVLDDPTEKAADERALLERMAFEYEGI
jgi:hypothetical protein